MNIERGKESFTEEEERDLQMRINLFKAAKGKTWPQLAGLTGITFGTLTTWAGGHYNGGKGSQDVCALIDRFFRHHEAQEDLLRNGPEVPSFQETPTAKRVMGALAYAHTGEFVAIIGDPGTGKTATIDQYVGTKSNAFKATMSPVTANTNPMLLTVLRAMGSKRNMAPGILLLQELRERLVDRRALLVIDEAQHASELALEQLRAVFDETGCGLVLAGNRTVLGRIEGASREAAYAQLYSRLSSRLILAAPQAGDAEVLLNAWQVSDRAERQFLKELALKPGGGGVRILTAVLKYATFMANGIEEPRVLGHFKDAWRDLSARTATA